jgi:uncharacterized Rmd1/YagE family protein
MILKMYCLIEESWEPEYQRLCSYLDMPLRLVVINKRLDVLRELLDVVRTYVYSIV